jgi:hypothetical protein
MLFSHFLTRMMPHIEKTTHRENRQSFPPPEGRERRGAVNLWLEGHICHESVLSPRRTRFPRFDSNARLVISFWGPRRARGGPASVAEAIKGRSDCSCCCWHFELVCLIAQHSADFIPIRYSNGNCGMGIIIKFSLRVHGLHAGCTMIGI